MILLFGGTSDAAPIAQRLADGGYRVLVSQATNVPLELPQHSRIEMRSGLLDALALADLIRDREIMAIVDAAHPYAAQLHETAERVACEQSLPYFGFVRPSSIDGDVEGVVTAPDHDAAAQLAFAHGQPVLLTIGSKNLGPYAERSRQTGIPLIVRVLDRDESIQACVAAGIPESHVLSGRGPFTVEDNRREIRRFRIGVLVTKDSGPQGGTREKLEAARQEGCRVVVVRRPPRSGENVFDDVDQLLRAVTASRMTKFKSKPEA